MKELILCYADLPYKLGSVNCYLIKTDTVYILIDTGSSNKRTYFEKELESAGCDMPFLNPEVVEMLFQRAKGHDAVIHVWENEMLEPLHAVYSTRPMAIGTENAIKNGDKIALAPIFELKDVVFVDMEDVRALDPGLRTFININTLEDMELIEE